MRGTYDWIRSWDLLRMSDATEDRREGVAAMGDGDIARDATEGAVDDATVTDLPDIATDGGSDFVPDMESEDFQAYLGRMRRPEPMIGPYHVAIPLIGVLLACMCLALPFALDRAVIVADDGLATQAERGFAAMGDEEKGYRLALAQRHNAMVSGWDAWSLISDNDGKAGRDGHAQEDIENRGDSATEAPERVTVSGDNPLDVSGGLIGWASLPTGRKVAVCDAMAVGDGKANMLRHERWSEWPVGGHGTTCVLSLDKVENADAVAQDLLALEAGDTVTLHVLDDAYAYEVDGIDSGTTTSVMQRVAKQSKDDTLAILVDRDSMTHIVTAHRVRFDGNEATGVTSPPVRRDMSQMTASIVTGLAISAIFVVFWNKGRKGEGKEKASEGDGK